MTSKERLLEYIKADVVYQEWKQNKDKEFSDFERFCIQHCEDIKEILKENKQLKKLCDKYEEEHSKYFNLWKKTIEKYENI